MSPKQTCVRFAHPSGERSSSEWRQALLKQSPDTAGALEGVTVYQSDTALSFTAQSPEASTRLRADAVSLMRTVAGMAGRMLDVEVLDLQPAVARTGFRWRYRVPRFVVARSAEDWAPWRVDVLTEDRVENLRKRIESDLQKQLALWGMQGYDSPDSLAIEVESAGVPMPLKNAVSFGPKPVSAMARKEVVFSSAARIEGAFWVGLLQATGHGRIYRDGYQAGN